jgi:hypothetical protein
MTNRLLLEAGLGNTYYQWGDRELDPNPTRNLIRATENQAVINPTGQVGTDDVRSQNWLINKTDGANWFLNTSYITGSHSMKFGYQGNYWADDREIHANDQALLFTMTRGARFRSPSTQTRTSTTGEPRWPRSSRRTSGRWGG